MLLDLVKEFSRKGIKNLVNTFAVVFAVHSFDKKVITNVKDLVPNNVAVLNKILRFFFRFYGNIDFCSNYLRDLMAARSTYIYKQNK